MFGSTNLVTEAISQKLANRENLSEEEQSILKEELKIAKSRIWISRLSVFLIIFIEIVFFVYIAYRVSLGLTAMGADENQKPKKEHIAVLNLDKPINDKYADKFISRLLQLEKDPNVKAIVVRLRSPGGSPSASWNIATTLKEVQSNKPLYTYVDSAAVSGSYLIASQSERIYANKFAMVGSIGVIIEHYVIGDLAKKLGVGQETITAGKYKKTISMFKYLSDEDRKFIEDNLLNEVYVSFKEEVAKGRGISLDKLEDYTEGKVFVASKDNVQGILVDQLIDWPMLKKLIKKDKSFSNEMPFYSYKLEKKGSTLSSLIGTSFDLNLNLDTLKNNVNMK